MPPRLSDHPAYQPLKRAVTKNQVDVAERVLTDVGDESVRRELVHRAARWAFLAQSLEAFALVLQERWGFSPDREITTGDEALVLFMLYKSGPGTDAASAFPAFVRAAVKAGIPLDHPRYHPHIPLAVAAGKTDVALMTALLDAGADPNGQYRYVQPDGQPGHSWPPLLLVQTVEGVRLLLERGANPGLAAPGSGEVMGGGISHVLHKWRNENELSALWEAFVAAGGAFLTPMETTAGEFNPLAVTIMIREVGHSLSAQYASMPELAERFLKEEVALQQRRHLLQDLLVGHGLDLNTPSPFRFPWKEFVQDSGSPRLKRQIALEDALPAVSSSKPGKPRF